MDSASLELTYRLMTLSEGRTISSGCVGAHVTPCVEGIGHGHIRRMQYHEAFACLVGLALGAVGLATPALPGEMGFYDQINWGLMAGCPGGTRQPQEATIR